AGVAALGVPLRCAGERERLPEQRIRNERRTRRRCSQWPPKPKDAERMRERRRENGVDYGDARAELAQVREGPGRLAAPRSGERQQYPGDRSHGLHLHLAFTPPAWFGVTVFQRAN